MPGVKFTAAVTSLPSTDKLSALHIICGTGREILILCRPITFIIDHSAALKI